MFTVRKVFVGETLIFAGDLSPHIYLVKSGQFKATKRIVDADRLLGMIHPGEFIGEMAYLMNSDSHASDVAAVVDSEVIEIPKDNFYEVLASNPVWLKALVKSLVMRIEALNKKV
jgi:CRP-like cAMP-binding protein